jgi:SAM-dependent methyltransferase
MAEGAKGTATDAYLLTSGDDGAARLRLVDEVYGESTRRMLLEAGLKEGMRVLDLACGVGTISCWLAGVVGATGSVVGIDVNPGQLEVAKGHWQQCEGLPPVEFLEASAYETGLPADSFDLVHCRLLLCHLTRPTDVLAEMYRVLRPGGVLVCQDIHGSSMFAHPHSDAYARSIELAFALGKILGVNYDFGLDLHRVAVSVGFREPMLSFDRPAFLRGEKKRMWEHTFTEAVPMMLKSGVASQEELATLVREMHALALQEDVMLAPWGMPGVWAVK